MSWVVSPDNTHVGVANLGWLLRHDGDIAQFRVYPAVRCVKNRVSQKMWEIPTGMTHTDAVLVADLEDGRMFVCRWASHTIMWEWLNRPRFRGQRVQWFGVWLRIGNPQHL